jgi:hypothetical protein
MKLDGIVASESYNVYSQIDQFKVWESLLGFSVRLNEKIVNTLRNDSKPGCWLYEYDNVILLADFADVTYHGISCIDGVMLKYHCNYTRALEIIKQNVSFKQVNTLSLTTKQSKDWKFELAFTSGNWNNHHKEYWLQYDISKKQLESENCYPVSSYSFNSRYCPHFMQKVRTYDETTAIVVDKKIKIYKPNSTFKFLSNFNENTIGGTNTITDTVIITKSIKDYMVLDNLGYSSRFIHSETSNPDLSMFKNYDKVYVLMDNDETGLNACNRLSSINNFTGISIPEGYPKDISDFYKTYGYTETKHLIRQLVPKSTSHLLSAI